MGCDIHSFAEKKDANGIWKIIPDLSPFDWRSYALYGWLANVRNYSGLVPISERRGLPEAVSLEVKDKHALWDCDAHSTSWLTVEELLAFDYDQPCEDRRVSRQIGPNHWDGGQTCEAGEGRMTTYREMFGERLFEDLEKLKAAGAERVVFWFDN